mgnify:CR=1 FL=1
MKREEPELIAEVRYVDICGVCGAFWQSFGNGVNTSPEEGFLVCMGCNSKWYVSDDYAKQLGALPTMSRRNHGHNPVLR